MNRLPIAAGITSLIVSSFSLGMSAWAVGCGDTTAAERGANERAAIAAPPATPATAPASAAKRAPDPVQPIAAAKEAATPAEATRPEASRGPSNGQRADARDLRVKRLVVARGVENREPVEEGRAVVLDGKPVYAFLEMANGSAHDGEVVVTFERGGVTTGHVELSVPAGAGRWRTWGLTRGIRAPGSWVAVVRTAGGEELARKPFDVATGDEPSSLPAAGEATPTNAAMEAAPKGAPPA